MLEIFGWAIFVITIWTAVGIVHLLNALNRHSRIDTLLDKIICFPLLVYAFVTRSW